MVDPARTGQAQVGNPTYAIIACSATHAGQAFVHLLELPNTPRTAPQHHPYGRGGRRPLDRMRPHSFALVENKDLLTPYRKIAIPSPRSGARPSGSSFCAPKK